MGNDGMDARSMTMIRCERSVNICSPVANGMLSKLTAEIDGADSRGLFRFTGSPNVHRSEADLQNDQSRSMGVHPPITQEKLLAMNSQNPVWGRRFCGDPTYSTRW